MVMVFVVFKCLTQVSEPTTVKAMVHWSIDMCKYDLVGREEVEVVGRVGDHISFPRGVGAGRVIPKPSSKESKMCIS